MAVEADAVAWHWNKTKLNEIKSKIKPELVVGSGHACPVIPGEKLQIGKKMSLVGVSKY
jgi:hypothetical protein